MCELTLATITETCSHHWHHLQTPDLAVVFLLKKCGRLQVEESSWEKSKTMSPNLFWFRPSALSMLPPIRCILHAMHILIGSHNTAERSGTAHV